MVDAAVVMHLLNLPMESSHMVATDSLTNAGLVKRRPLTHELRAMCESRALHHAASSTAALETLSERSDA